MTDLYEKLGNVSKAKEECRNVLLIDPENGEAKKRLDNLSKPEGS
jgi:hypothetical protein